MKALEIIRSHSDKFHNHNTPERWQRKTSSIIRNSSYKCCAQSIIKLILYYQVSIWQFYNGFQTSSKSDYLSVLYALLVKNLVVIREDQVFLLSPKSNIQILVASLIYFWNILPVHKIHTVKEYWVNKNTNSSCWCSQGFSSHTRANCYMSPTM